ncbi:MAG: ABC transporter permease [Wenzhouxiangellaceae bacterium]
MLSYNLRLAWLSIRQRPGLTLLAIAAIAVGLGVLMTVQTQAYQIRSLPIGDDSEKIYLVQMDNRDVSAPNIDEISEMPSLSYRDAQNLLQADSVAGAQTLTWKTRGIVTTVDRELNPIRGFAVATNYQFFDMFNTPFKYGAGWTVDADDSAAAVVVISDRLNDQLFGGEDSVGRRIRMIDEIVTIVGVLDYWPLKSQFYDRTFFRGFNDDIFLPSTFALKMNMPRYTRIDCRAAERPRMPLYRLANAQGIMNSECAWINLWVKLDNAGAVEEYKDFMSGYVAEQKQLGRFPREENNFLETIVAHQRAILAGSDRFALYERLAWFFAAVCLLNTIVIFLARYVRKKKEIAVRRALGAKRKVLLGQYLIELVVVGVLGGLGGILLAYAGLYAMLEVYLYSTDYIFPRESVQQTYIMNWQLLLTALTIGIAGTVLAGLYPVWKVCHIPPAPQLKAE